MVGDFLWRFKQRLFIFRFRLHAFDVWFLFWSLILRAIFLCSLSIFFWLILLFISSFAAFDAISNIFDRASALSSNWPRLWSWNGVSVKWGPDGCGWRIKKCGWKNADDKMRMKNCQWHYADDKIPMREINLRCFLKVLFVNKASYLIELRSGEVQYFIFNPRQVKTF